MDGWNRAEQIKWMFDVLEAKAKLSWLGLKNDSEYIGRRMLRKELPGRRPRRRPKRRFMNLWM